MLRLSHAMKAVSYLAIISLLGVGLFVPIAQAGLIGTEAIVNAADAHSDRDRVKKLLAREDIRNQLLALGVDPDEAGARVQGMTDSEAQTLAGKLDQLPAGGGVVEAVLIVFLVLLFTDIMGFTDVFPFVNKPAR